MKHIRKATEMVWETTGIGVRSSIWCKEATKAWI